MPFFAALGCGVSHPSSFDPAGVSVNRPPDRPCTPNATSHPGEASGSELPVVVADYSLSPSPSPQPTSALQPFTPACIASFRSIYSEYHI